MNQNKKSLSYEDSGVSIDAGNQLVESIKPFIKKTHRPETISKLGGFSGLFKLDLKKYHQPVLVASTDGVGTKLKIALEMNRFDTIGQDCVAMCVNDLICCGAEPLFFLDYYATGKLNNNQAKEVIKSMALSLATINTTLLGGETAEMPGLYQPGDFDIAGFSVGVVNHDDIIEGPINVKKNDVIIGLASSGLHSNGYSLARKILETNNINLDNHLDLKKPVGEVLLEPTILYVNAVLELKEKIKIHALAHITGGGLVENIPRVLPENLAAQIEIKKLNRPQIFNTLQKLGNVEENEMFRVFNCGTGFIIIVDSQDEKTALTVLKNFQPKVIGKVIDRNSNGVELV